MFQHVLNLDCSRDSQKEFNYFELPESWLCMLHALRKEAL